MSEIQIVCPKCNGTKSYLGLPPAKFGDGSLDPVPMCAKCDIQMYDPVLRKKTVKANRRRHNRVANANIFGEFGLMLFKTGAVALLFFTIYLYFTSK